MHKYERYMQKDTEYILIDESRIALFFCRSRMWIASFHGIAWKKRCLEGVHLPENLKKLVFGDSFNQPVESVIFPNSLQELTFGSLASKSTYFSDLEELETWFELIWLVSDPLFFRKNCLPLRAYFFFPIPFKGRFAIWILKTQDHLKLLRF